VTEGTNKVVGRDPSCITAAAMTILKEGVQPRSPNLWDGKAGERVADGIIAHVYHMQRARGIGQHGDAEEFGRRRGLGAEILAIVLDVRPIDRPRIAGDGETARRRRHDDVLSEIERGRRGRRQRQRRACQRGC